MATKKKKSFLETILITIVRFGLSVKATLSTTVNSIKTRRQRRERSAEVKADAQKRKSSLEKYRLYYEDMRTGKKFRSIKAKEGKREKSSKNTK